MQVLEWTKDCQLESIRLHRATILSPSDNSGLSTEVKKVVDLLLPHCQRKHSQQALKRLTIGGVFLEDATIQRIITASNFLEHFGFCIADRDLVRAKSSDALGDRLEVLIRSF